MDTNKYYIVKCKHGHVGRNNYLPLDIPVQASTQKEAASIARIKGGVKRNHTDWCIEPPREVILDEYTKAMSEYVSDPYWEKKTRSNLDNFAGRLCKEQNYYRYNDIKTNKKRKIKKSKDCSPWFVDKKRAQFSMRVS